MFISTLYLLVIVDQKSAINVPYMITERFANTFKFFSSFEIISIYGSFYNNFLTSPITNFHDAHYVLWNFPGFHLASKLERVSLSLTRSDQ